MRMVGWNTFSWFCSRCGWRRKGAPILVSSQFYIHARSELRGGAGFAGCENGLYKGKNHGSASSNCTNRLRIQQMVQEKVQL